MSCSRNCSTRAAALLAILCACAGAQRAPARQLRIAVFPPANLSNAAAPMKELRGELEAALRARQIEIVERAPLEEFLARHRVRYTGGLDRETAIAAAAELGVTGVLITSIEAFRPEPPRLSLTLRLVSSGDAPAIVWIDGVSRAGDDAPGPFDLGVITDPAELQAKVFGDLAASLAAFRDGKGPRAKACAPAKRFGPRNPFRSPLLDPSASRKVAVLPFLNETPRRGAGETLALEFVRQLEAAGNFQVVEPGLVRDELLRYRIVTEEGVSLDTARVVSELLRTDLVLAGYVRDYDDGGVPRVDFTVLLLDNANSEILWQGSSHNRGDDGVWFFDAGTVGTAAGLACRMARSAVDGMNRKP